MDLLNGMTTFVRVVDAGSLAKAARALRVSPAAVSRQLAALERELGVALIVRTTRSIAVTDEGRRFYAGAQRALREVEDARLGVRRDGPVQGLLSVSVPIALGVGRLGGSLPALIARHPGLRVDLRLEDNAVDLVADGVDVAIRAGIAPPDHASVIAHRVATGERVVVAAPSYLRKHGEPKLPAQLAGHVALIQLTAGGALSTWELGHGDASVVVEVDGPVRASGTPALCSAAVAGGGIAMLPRFLVEAALGRGDLRILALGGWAPRPQHIYAVHRAEQRSLGRVRAFVDHVRRTGALV